MGREPEQTLLPRRITNGQQVYKRCSTSLPARQMQINAQMRYLFILFLRVNLFAFKATSAHNASSGPFPSTNTDVNHLHAPTCQTQDAAGGISSQVPLSFPAWAFAGESTRTGLGVEGVAASFHQNRTHSSQELQGPWWGP